MSGDGEPARLVDLSIDELEGVFEDADYVAESDIVTTVHLALRLGKPLLVEGPPGAGKTELAKVLAAAVDTDLVRLQCYEGLTAENTLYEWNYTKQLLAVQAGSADVDGGSSELTDSVFSEEYLLERPLLEALRGGDDDPQVLLIDEVDRADEEFEALLLEVLSDFQVTVPELGSIEAPVPPIVVITSNRTRGLSDALKRRCLYLYIEPPSFEKELDIVERKVPFLDVSVARQVVNAVQQLREEPLRKQPGVSETLDWARAVGTLQTDGEGTLTDEQIRRTIGCLLKEAEDVERVDDDLIARMLEAEREATAEPTVTGDGSDVE